MTRQRLIRRQIAVGVVALFLALIALGIRSFLLSFAYQVPLGSLREVVLIVNGPVLRWDDPATLQQFRAALPGYRPGPGYKGYVHSHETLTLVLKDDQGREVALDLPTEEGPVVSIAPSRKHPRGNSWNMPELLGLLGRLGTEALEAQGINDPTAKYYLEHWRDTFGKGKTSAA